MLVPDHPEPRLRQSARRRMLVAVLALMAVGGGLRLFVAWWVAPLGLVGDEVYYVRVAQNIASGRGHVSANGLAVRPPAHPYLLSFFTDPEVPLVKHTKTQRVRIEPGDALWSLIVLEVGLSTLLIGATVLLGRFLFDHRTGILAGLIVALYPNLIGFSHYLWATNLFALLITMALAGVALGARNKSYAVAVLTGLVFGAAALTREVGIPVAGAGALWWLLMAGRGERWLAVRRGALLLACAAAVVLPWTWRNYKLLDHFVPVSTIGWYNVAVGNIWHGWLTHSSEGRKAFNSEYHRRSELDGVDFARARALKEIRSDQPFWIVKKSLRVPPRLLAPGSFVFHKIRKEGYGEVARSTARMLLIVTGTSYILVYLAGVLGASSAGGGRGTLAGLVFGVVIGLHILVIAVTRYRVPFMPLLMVYASYALLNWCELPLRLSQPARVVGGLVIVHFLSLCVVHHYWLS